MRNITSLGIDIAKNVFQLHGADKTGHAILKQKITRAKLPIFMANLPPCNVFMEACGSANYWGREFEKMGHKVKLIHPKYVKPYVMRNKNDKNDAAGIMAAAHAPGMRFCSVKTEAQQDVQSIHRMRSLLIQQRTALANQVRGILAEYGIIMPQGINKIRKDLVKILDSKVGKICQMVLDCLLGLYENLKRLDAQIADYDKKIKILFMQNETCKKLAKIPGIGELGATILAAVLGNGAAFKNGRHFSAFLGLTPKQHSSGGKERLLGISKGGDTYIRTLLIHGARAVLSWVKKKSDHPNVWARNLAMRRGVNKAAVALANKMARIAWAVVHENTEYDANYKAKNKSGAKCSVI